jgi:hypothetical protein
MGRQKLTSAELRAYRELARAAARLRDAQSRAERARASRQASAQRRPPAQQPGGRP